MPGGEPSSSASSARHLVTLREDEVSSAAVQQSLDSMAARSQVDDPEDRHVVVKRFGE